MVTKEEALKRALESNRKHERHRTLAETRYWCDQYKLLAQQAIEALAQPAQEPVGSLSVRYFRGAKSMTNTDFDYNGDLPEGDYELYTHPPQRSWVGLTDDECRLIYTSAMEAPVRDQVTVCKTIEAKLKEKNS